MKIADILQIRLYNQLLTHKKIKTPGEVVSWFGAVQSQDFEGAKWAVGQRIEGSTEAIIQHAYDKGEILRTHVMRPTWHFISPADIKWLLALTGSRVNAACATTFRQVQLDDKIFQSSNAIITKALQKGQPLTRNELKIALQQKKIRTDEIRMICLLLKAEIDGLICSGPRQGNQFTYMLLDERVTASKIFNKEEALAELTKRYFNSHGPATIKDFAWWSGLTITDAKKGVELIKSYLQNEIAENETFWFSSSLSSIKEIKPAIQLLPAFDEYTVAYKNRNNILHKDSASQSSTEILNPVILQKGQVIGKWKRIADKKNVSIKIAPFISLSQSAIKNIRAEAKSYAKFIGRKMIL
jgi:Winged helix DNA-binding domain